MSRIAARIASCCCVRSSSWTVAIAWPPVRRVGSPECSGETSDAARQPPGEANTWRLSVQRIKAVRSDDADSRLDEVDDEVCPHDRQPRRTPERRYRLLGLTDLPEWRSGSVQAGAGRVQSLLRPNRPA